jgi:hypothetical protein
MLFATDDSGNARPLTPQQKQAVAPWLAQWAANVIEFRDPDSTMSRYVFDPDPTNGVGNDQAQTVFGCERPEVVITETLAYDFPTTPVGAPAGRALFISLYRPWAATIQHEGAQLATERIDPILAPDVLANDRLANSLHLGKKEAGTGASIWRIRVKRSRADGTPEPDEKIALSDFESNPEAAIAPNAQVIIGTGPAAQLSIGTNPVGITGIFLERLADPNREHPMVDDDKPLELNPYIAVDYAPVFVNREPPAPQQVRAMVRNQTFWKSQFEPEERPIATGLLPASSPSQRGSYYHWPNRDFIGHAELMLVPLADGTAPDAPPFYRAPSKALEAYEPGGGPSLAPRSPAGNGTPLRLPEILDATIVPSRFMGTAVTVGNPSVTLKDTAWSAVPCNQLSRWREPGRINFNTVTDNAGNMPSQQGRLRPRRSLVEDLTTVGALVPPQLPEPFAMEPLPAVPRSIDNPVRKAVMDPAIAGGPWSSTSEMLVATAPMAASAGSNADFLRLLPAIRLSNVATVRSHVFAVWVTVKTENTMTGDSRTRRLFAIVDRSIPVGYRPGVDLNAADTIRLKRFLE